MINFMSNEDTLDTTDESEVLQTRDGWSLQRCKGKEEIWSPHRWHRAAHAQYNKHLHMNSAEGFAL